MSNQIFIAGKNWELSLAELIAYLQAQNNKFKIQYFSREFFIIEIEKKLDSSAIADLGGTIKIGQPKTYLPTNLVKEAFLKKNKLAQKHIAEKLTSSAIINGLPNTPDKLIFGVSLYFTDNAFQPVSGRMQRYIGSVIKEELKNLGKKANFIGYSSQRKQARLSHVEVIKKKLVENRAEILFCIGKSETWVAVTIAVHDPFEFQKRDIYKPNQRTIFAMPPRLARIMVNLSACREGKTLLDPFCGVGTILQEALLERSTVIGMDVNSWCVKAAKENLEWLAREYRLDYTDFSVIQGEVNKMSAKVGLESVDCIVSEPDLGPALRDVPTVPYAEKIIEKLEPLFLNFIQQAYRTLRPNGRLVLVTPYIRTRSNEPVSMSIDDKVEELGFKLVYAFTNDMFNQNLDIERLVHYSSIVEIDEKHKIGREIHILKKKHLT
jgi:tRNA G10  N-methylase Trm11